MDLLAKAKQEALRERLTLSAFIGWQMGAGAGLKFGEYLEGLGLLEGQVTAKVTPEDRKITAEEAIAKSEEILKMAANKGK